MDLKLKDKVALVTGSSSGLGYAVSQLLSLEGAKVIINARNSLKLDLAAEKIKTLTGNSVIPIAGDISDPAFPQKLIDEIGSRFGKLDILVTNAGGPPPGKFMSFDDSAWYAAFESTFMSHMRLIRAAVPFLEKSKFASVLTITSYAVKQPIPNLVLSNSIRAATVGLTKSLALELGENGIRFNSILPGWTATDRVEHLMQARAEQNNTSVEEELRKQVSESPLKRMATPEEFANAAVFLISPAASYITGTMLSVDGGMLKSLL